MERILLVDDEPEVLNGYLRVLHRRYNATGIGDPLQADLMLQTGAYAVVVSDYRMHNMDGLELLTRTMESSPDTVRILLTGVQDWEVAMRAVNECNVFRFIAKPIAPEAFFRVINDALEQYRLNRLLSAEIARQGGPVQKPVPICSYCKDVRVSDEDPRSPLSWERIELVFNRRFGLQFSHGICPKCAERIFHEVSRISREGEHA